MIDVRAGASAASRRTAPAEAQRSSLRPSGGGIAIQRTGAGRKRAAPASHEHVHLVAERREALGDRA